MTTDASNGVIRVLIVDDQALVRRGFRMVLEIESDLEILGEAADGLEAVARTRDLVPDVVLMDVRMPVLDGVEATRRITADAGCHAKVIMLTTFDMDDYVYDALEAGASGFLLKDIQPELLVAGIHAVHAGESLLAPSVTRRMIESFLSHRPIGDQADDARLATLTQRERETLELIARGLTNLEIADTLAVGPIDPAVTSPSGPNTIVRGGRTTRPISVWRSQPWSCAHCA
jgi:DNA-binding NarL/FixJ family response regulator